eukprot:g26725.t1
MTVFDRIESNVRGYCRSFPTTFTKAQNAVLYDEDGDEYLDFLAGAGTLNYGHNNPEIKTKLIEFLERDGMLHGLDMHTDTKERFLLTFEKHILWPLELDYKVQFTGPTGTNAVEAALKLARNVTGRTNVVSFTNGFHGVSLGSVAATGNSHFRDAAGTPLDNVTFMPYDGYLGDDVDTLEYFETVLRDSSSGLDLPAAVIVETVQGEGGVNVARDEWLQRLEELCNEFEILLIVDDIQVGCGRTGNYFSFENAGIVPDIVTLSKSLSAYGLPMSLVLMKSELDQWEPGQHNGTFRGNNLAFVSATEAIELYWKDRSLSRDVKHKGELIRKRLLDIAESVAEVMSVGELLSTQIAAVWLKAQGHPVEWKDARTMLTAIRPRHGASDAQEYLSATCGHDFDPQLVKQLPAGNEAIVLTQGFIAGHADGGTVLLGRGGSDTAAACLAARIGAERLEIWTDARTWVAISCPYEEVEDPIDKVRDTLRLYDLADKRIGFEKDCWFFTATQQERLFAHTPETSFVDCAGLVEAGRLIKSELEIEMIRKAARIAEAGMKAGIEAVQEGVTENDVAAEIHSAMIRQGGEWPAISPFVATGHRGSIGHQTWAGDIIKKNECVFLEVGGCLKRYHAAIMRTCFVGEPDPQILDAVKTVQEAVHASIEAIKPGMRLGEVDAVSRKIIGRAAPRFGGLQVTRSAYSIGIAFAPDWGEGHIISIRHRDPRVLQPNMTFHNIPWVQIPGKGGIGLSETIRMIGGIKPAALIAVPMFILAADIMTRGRSANRLLDVVTAFVGHLRGGLPIAAAVSCTLFGAMSGSTQATVVAIGGPLRPKLLAAGYSDSFTTALIINASDIALLIPPSIGMIVYGVVSGTSIGELFIAGVGPGLLILFLFCIYCWIASVRMQIPRNEKADARTRWQSSRRAVLPMGFPVIIIGGIYSGIFSPTEASAISVLYAVVLEVFLFRELSWKQLPEIAVSTGLVTAVVFVLVGAGAAFSWVISFSQLPETLVNDWLGLSADSGYWTIMLTIAVAFFIGCMFVDPIVVILILTPIFHPVAVAAGIDPVLVGIVVTLQVAIGSATPPFGCDIFTAIAIFRRPYIDVIRGTPPFILILLSAALLLIAVPEISLYLRDLAFE